MNIEEIVSSTFNGGIETIEFIQCHIVKLNAFAINIKHQSLYSLTFESSQIDTIESQAFKKYHINHFIMRNTTIKNPLPTRAFYDLNVINQMSITNSSFTTISSNAIALNGSK